ncbi:MAG: MarR family winged helix-turn-helix transcriptional regulator [Propionibacteriaceae bacterium]
MPSSISEFALELRLACMRLTRRVRYTASTLPPHQFSVLAFLDCVSVSTAAELAARERISAPSMSRIVNELADRGLITREPDATDKRRIQLSLTDQGRDLLTIGRQERNEWMIRRLETLSAEDSATLAEATIILNRLLEED